YLERIKRRSARARITHPGISHPLLGGDGGTAAHDDPSEMLRRILSLRPRQPRFPEGELVPWSGVVFAATTCSLALGAALAFAGDASARHWQAVALLTALAALTPLFTVYGPDFTVYDTASVFVVAAALLTSPALAVLVGIPACLVDALRRRVSVVSSAHNSAAN